METLVLERCILDAERAFEDKDYLEGMRLLQEALTIEPHYGKVHNHLGWLFIYHLNDWDKAELHLNMALKYGRGLNAPYIHMAHILFEKRRFNELEALLKNAASAGVQRSFICNDYGRMCEVNGKLRKAVRHYKEAIRNAFSDQEINVYKDNIRRCRDKRWSLLF